MADAFMLSVTLGGDERLGKRSHFPRPGAVEISGIALLIARSLVLSPYRRIGAHDRRNGVKNRSVPAGHHAPELLLESLRGVGTGGENRQTCVGQLRDLERLIRMLSAPDLPDCLGESLTVDGERRLPAPGPHGSLEQEGPGGNPLSRPGARSVEIA